MLTFGTFLEHAAAHFEREKGKDDLIALMPPLLDSHIFWLDDDQEFQKHITEIREDLIPEMREKIYLPFSDTTVVSVIRKGAKPIWTLDRMIEDPPYLRKLLERSEGSIDGQRILIVRYQLEENTPLVEEPLPVVIWVIVYHGVKGSDIHFNFIPSVKLHRLLESSIGKTSDEKWKQFQYESKVILDYAAALSHPENYIIAVTPELTPKEERKVASGRPRPPQKAKHFIVVDHSVLVRMRAGDGTHASPVPHERRGHWRRISERCRHARLMGKERVFVRPTLVGDPAWKREKNFYEVLPDLGKVQT